MDKKKDTLLLKQKSVSSEGYQYSFVTIGERVVVVVAAYIRLIWEVKNLKKTVNPIDVIKNAQTIFKDDDIKKDILWKEHCAGTLRELVDSHFEPNAMKVLKCLPKRSDSEQASILYESIGKYKEFLNEFSHLRTDNALKCAQEILDENDLNLIDEETFDKLCTNFIRLLYELFNKYCIRGSKT